MDLKEGREKKEEERTGGEDQKQAGVGDTPYNPNTQTQTGNSWVQSLLEAHSKFQINLGFTARLPQNQNAAACASSPKGNPNQGEMALLCGNLSLTKRSCE